MRTENEHLPFIEYESESRFLQMRLRKELFLIKHIFIRVVSD